MTMPIAPIRVLTEKADLITGKALAAPEMEAPAEIVRVIRDVAAQEEETAIPEIAPITVVILVLTLLQTPVVQAQERIPQRILL